MRHRADIKAEAKAYIRCGAESPVLISLLVVVITGVLDNLSVMSEYGNLSYEELMRILESGEEFPSVGNTSPITTFFTILSALVISVLYAGYYSYCMGIRRGERMPVTSLLDGLSVAGKVIWCEIQMYMRITLWSMLFVIPGIIAAYRYRFAIYNIISDPSLSASQAIALSCSQTAGMKWDLFVLDLSFIGWNLLSALTLGILNIWVMPYATFSDLGYYEESLRHMTS